MKTIQTHQQYALAQQRQMVDQALMAFERGQLQSWELYSGSGNLWLQFDLNNGWDFTNREHQKAFLALQDRLEPRFIWIAPPCKKWSSLQRLNCQEEWQQDLLQADSDIEENTHLKFT